MSGVEKNELDKKRFSLNDVQKLCVGALAVAALWYNQIRESDRIRADFREYVAVQTGVDKMQDFKIDQTKSTMKMLFENFGNHLDRSALKPEDIHIESE